MPFFDHVRLFVSLQVGTISDDGREKEQKKYPTIQELNQSRDENLDR